MAETKDTKGIEPGESVSVPAVDSVATVAPANADKTSAPNDNDAKANQPPVRTNRPDVAIAQVLAVGAGAHEPPDDPHVGADGRWYDDVAAARAASSGFMTDAELDARYGKAPAS